MFYLILHITLEQDEWTKAPGGSTFEPLPQPFATFKCARTSAPPTSRPFPWLCFRNQHTMSWWLCPPFNLHLVSVSLIFFNLSPVWFLISVKFLWMWSLYWNLCCAGNRLFGGISNYQILQINLYERKKITVTFPHYTFMTIKVLSGSSSPITHFQMHLFIHVWLQLFQLLKPWRFIWTLQCFSSE